MTLKVCGLTHLIVTSDHGMAAVDVRNRRIALSKLIDISAIERMPGDGPITHIEAVQGREEELYRDLSVISHMRVYKKQDIPDRWHYKHNRRILPLLGVAEEGWMIFQVTVHQLSRAVGEKCLRTCANRACSDHPAHVQSIIRAFALNSVSAG